MSHAKTSLNASKHPVIFVVDDEPMLLDLAVAILEPLGYNVRTFRDPQTVLAELPAARPLLVVTDYAMGGMTGMHLIQECRRINPDQKTMLLSGTVEQACFANDSSQPDIFLAKPYQVSEFVKSVKELTGI